MASLPPFKSPGANSRRVLEHSSLRDASLSQPLPQPPPPQTPGTTSRRKSIKDRTPRQVTALLSARKSRPSASSKGRRSAGLGLGGLLGGGRGEDTPGGLIRALSRMPDLPPPTPEELEQDPTTIAQQLPLSDPNDPHNPLRDSILGQPLPGPLISEAPSSDPTSSSAPSSSARKPPNNNSTKKAPRSSFFTTSLGRAYTPAFPLPQPQGSEAGFEALAEREEEYHGHDQEEEEEEEEEAPSSGSDVAASLLSHSHSQSQRSAGADERRESVASVERARRISRVSSGFGGSPAGRGRVSEYGGESEMGAEEEEGGRRFSAVSQGSEKGGGRSSLASTLGGGRPSLAPSTTVGDEVEVEDEAEVEQFQFGPEDGEEEEFQWHEEMGGGGEEEAFEKFEGEHEEEDEGERIPWERKGKGRALDEEEEEVDFGAEGAVDEQEEGGWQEDEDEQMNEQYGSDQEDDEAGEVAASLTSQRLPPAPPLAKVAANRKKRLAVGGAAGTRTTKKKRTQRFTPTGHPVPDLPLHRQKALLQHFLGPNVKVDEKGMEEVMDASQEFFAQLMQDTSAYARHAGRKHLINEQDLVMLLTRQRILTPKNRLQTHGRRLGLDRELQSVLDGIGGAGDGAGAGAKKGRKRKGDGEAGDGGRRKKGKGKAREEEGSEDEEEEGSE